MNIKDPKQRAEFIYGQPMNPCPKCSSYNMKAQIPILMEHTEGDSIKNVLVNYARATSNGATKIQGPAYYMCWDCFHKGPSVDCTGRTSEDCRSDKELNSEMKHLWNSQ